MLDSTLEFFNAQRSAYLNSVRELLQQKRNAAALERKKFFCPDESSPATYEADLVGYRQQLAQMLGWPLNLPKAPAHVEVRPLETKTGGRVYQVNWTVAGLVRAFGLLFLPQERGRYPLVLAQHGGLGSPELASGLLDGNPANYNQLVRGLLPHNVAVFAPQLLVWHEGQKPSFDQNLLNREFQHLGGSRAALDLRTLQTALDWLVTHEEIDASRIGMTGLSYGGFYTLFLTALDARIRVAVSSCFINDRFRYNWEDWVWTGSANHFLDAEVGRMICPRPLFLEAGEKDEVFSVEGFLPVAEEIAGAYQRLGLGERCQFRTHPGGHEYDTDGAAQAFLLKWL